MINLRRSYLVCVICVLAVMWSAVFSFAEELYEERLDKGLKNTEPYSYLLMENATTDPSNAKKLLTDAIRYSPDLPATYFEKARISFSLSADSLFESLDTVIQGFKAYKRNFWWLFGISGLFLISSMLSFVLVLIAVIGIRLFIEIPLLSHDIKEDKRKALIALSLIPLSFFGPLFFIAGMLCLLGLYFSRLDKVIVYCSIIFLLMSPFLLRVSGMFFSAASPELRAIVSVNENRDNKYAISALKGRDDYISIFSYALALKREGHYEEAITAYNNILSKAPDALVLVNLGNCYVGAKDLNSAKEFYKKSLAIKPLASAYYNLSQVSRETLDFADGEKYFLEASRLSSEAVSRFASTTGRNPNRFVIDETLSMSMLWEYTEGKAENFIKVSSLNSALTAVAAVALLILFSMLDIKTKSRAYRCNRCGMILCGICGKEMLWGQMCSNCYKSMVKMDGVDPRERVAKLREVQELRERKRNIARILSFTIPGIAHIYSGSILTGGLFLWSFLFLLGLVLFNPFFSMGLSLFSHNWLTVPALIFMAFLYLISNISARRELNRGWL